MYMYQTVDLRYSNAWAVKRSTAHKPGIRSGVRLISSSFLVRITSHNTKRNTLSIFSL